MFLSISVPELLLIDRASGKINFFKLYNLPIALSCLDSILPSECFWGLLLLMHFLF